MSVPVTITLNSIVGSPGPFNLYSCTGSTCSVTPFETNVPLSGLTSGYGTSLAPAGTTHIKIKSTAVGCDYETAPISISNIPTPTPTPTVTATPTATPTVTPTHTPTPTPTLEVTEVTITVKYHGASEPLGNLACNTGTDIQVVMDSAIFCNAETYVSSHFTSIGTGTFWISYNGKYRQIYHSSGNSATQAGTCKDCVGVEPTIYYYAMGDCTDMKYSGIETTIFGFGAPLQVNVCMNEAQITQWFNTANHAQQTLSIDYDNPCGFGDSYVSTIIAQSSTEIAERTVFNIDNQCLSVVSVDEEYVSGTTVNLDEETSVGIGWDACSTCFPPFTGFTIMGYSGVTCDTEENVIAYSLLGGFTLGNVYGIQMYSGGTATGERICMTLNANLGAQFVIEDPETEGISGYQISDTGISTGVTLTTSGYTNCSACNAVVEKYMITGDRCDTTGSVTIWSDTAPTVVSGNTISVNILGTIVCFLVTQADQFTSVVYNDLGYTIFDTGCDCNGDNGGGDINVDNIVFAPTVSRNTGDECQSQSGQYYNETTIDEIQLTFRDSSNNPVEPNGAVEYRVDGGTWQPLIVTGNTVTFSVTLIYGDKTNCGESTYSNTLDIKVGTVTVDTYTAGAS